MEKNNERLLNAIFGREPQPKALKFSLNLGDVKVSVSILHARRRPSGEDPRGQRSLRHLGPERLHHLDGRLPERLQPGHPMVQVDDRRLRHQAFVGRLRPLELAVLGEGDGRHGLRNGEDKAGRLHAFRADEAARGRHQEPCPELRQQSHRQVGLGKHPSQGGREREHPALEAQLKAKKNRWSRATIIAYATLQRYKLDYEAMAK